MPIGYAKRKLTVVGVTSFDQLKDAKFSESLKMQSLKVEKFQQGKKV